MDKLRARGNARCRTCYDNSGASNFYPLHDKFSDSQSLGDLLMEIAKIDTKTENVDATLPQHLCGNCSRKLKSAYYFVLQAQSVNAQLLSYLSAGCQVERSKLDGLLAEDLIDIPSHSNECVQVKLEIDYTESSLCDGEIKQTADGSAVGLLKQEELVANQETPSSSNEGNCKFDPITIAETHWQSDDDDSNIIEPNYESETASSDSEVAAPSQRRQRGRPRMTNKSSQRISRQLANKLQCDKVPKDLIHHRRRKDDLHSHMKVHGNRAAAAVCKKELNRTKQAKVIGMDKNLCKPNGCKQIQCMICCSKHSKISDLRTHLRTHQNVVSFAQRRSQESIGDISALLYPDEPVMSQESLAERIIADVSGQQLERFYSITNEVGYELSINSSETESDSDAEIAGQTDTRHSYSCEVCGEYFRRKYKFFEHQKWAHSWEEAVHVCTQCNSRFLSAEFLQRHCEQQCNNTLKRFVCRKCPRRFMWKDNLKTHLRMIHAEVDETKTKPDVPSSYDCLQCQRNFKTLKGYTRHMVIHRTDAVVFKCLWCPRKFYRQENLHMHIWRHGVGPDCLVAAECMISATTAPNGVKKIFCKVCNLQFDCVTALRSHLLQESASAASPHHNFNSLFNYSITNKLGFELQIDDSETDEEARDAFIKAEGTPLKYTCQICSLTCRRKFEMSQHQRSMHKHEQIPLKCEKCIFKTVSQEILSHHMRTQCFNMEKQFQCHKCSFKFMWQENLQNHQLLMHAEQETDPSIDNQAPSNSAAPADSKMFECDKCHRLYHRKDRLTTHIKKMHTEGGSGSEKPDDSQIDPRTGEKFKKPVLKKKFLCTLCGRGVSSSSNLIIHMRRHTGEKPFKCDFCDMAFPRSSDLQSHRRKHTGEKPYKCTVCDKAFSLSFKLQKHARIHLAKALTRSSKNYP